MDKKIFLAKGAHVTGQVSLGDQVGIWYNAVVRGDCDSIQIGNGSNVQDNVTIHTDIDYPVKIGEYVSIGHNAVVHGCTIGDNTVIGMGAILLNGAVIGKNCMIGAGALVTQGMHIPNNTIAFGNPAKCIRKMTPEEIAHNTRNAKHYIELLSNEQ